MIYLFIAGFILYIVGSVMYAMLIAKVCNQYSNIVKNSMDQVKDTVDQMNKLALAKNVYDYKSDEKVETNDELDLPKDVPMELAEDELFYKMINKTINPEEEEVING